MKATYKDRWVETARPSFPDWQQPGKGSVVVEPEVAAKQEEFEHVILFHTP